MASAPATNAPDPFYVKQGFRLELVASDPVVSAPVAMAFDESGRLFVVERPLDADRPNSPSHAGRVRLLEDTNGDGTFNTSTVYADNLPWASAVACYDGGVFVAAGPEILYLKDSKTNGIADVRKVAFSGFGGTKGIEAQSLPNNFNWGLDNRIHAASGGIAGFVPAASTSGTALESLQDVDFSFDPRALTMHAEAGPSQSGLTFDNWGREFTCDFTRPLRAPTFEPRYLERNRFFPRPPDMYNVASPVTTLYRAVLARIPMPEAERSRGTNRTVSVAMRAANVLGTTWFTNAQGCVAYRGTAFPTSYLGNVFVADPAAHAIHRFVLREVGLDATAYRPADEARTEFLLSSDPAFYPQQIVNGPDGALYVADRRAGGGGGRIYRIVPEDFRQSKPPQLGKASTYDLVAILSSPNGWHRDTAARLLYERQDPKAVPLLQSTLGQSRLPITRLYALHLLDGLGALKSWHVLLALRDSNAQVRQDGVLLSEKLIQDGVMPDAIWTRFRALAGDPSIRVRYQLALTVGEVRQRNRAQILAPIFWQNPGNIWIENAVLSSLANGAGTMFVAVAGDARLRGNPAAQEFLRRLTTMIGAQRQPQEVARALGFMEQPGIQLQPAFELLYALGAALQRAGSSLSQEDPQGRLKGLYDQAQSAALNTVTVEPLRVAGIRLLGVSTYGFADTGDLLLLPLGSGQPQAVQLAALEALGRFNDPQVAPALFRRWRILSPRLRNAAVTALLSRADRAGTVLTALENKQISPADLSSEQVNYLRTIPDPGLAQRAVALFGPGPIQHPGLVQQFRLALTLGGNPNRGRAIFQARCASCHVPSGGLSALGPDLITARIYGREPLLSSILEPNAEVDSQKPTCIAETAEGQALVGQLQAQNDETITVQRRNRVPAVFPRPNIQFLQTQSWSLMPEGLADGLTPANMADLLEYVLTEAP